MRDLGQPKAYVKYVGAMGVEGARGMTDEQISKIMRKGNTKKIPGISLMGSSHLQK